MCFGGDDGSAARAQAAQTQAKIQADEDARQAKIRTGQSTIDQSFGQFNDPYFDKFRSDFVAANNPDINNQYSVAKDKLTAALADRGVLNSSIAGSAFGDLDKKLNDTRADISNKAFDAANQFKGQVEKTKSDLYSLNTASADPDAIAARATGEATALVPPKTSTSLGDLFGSVLAPVAAYQRAATYSPTGRSIFSAPTSGSGNGRVYG